MNEVQTATNPASPNDSLRQPFLFRLPAWRLFAAILALIPAAFMLATSQVQAGVNDQAKRIHERLTGTLPDDDQLNAMLAIMDPAGSGQTTTALAAQAALAVPLNDPLFYRITLKRWITPWTNLQQDPYAPLNDYTATIIGIVASTNPDFRRVITDDVLFTGAGVSGIPAWSASDNRHYEALDELEINLRTVLRANNQTALTGLPTHAVAGVLTSRTAGSLFFNGGTNRAIIRHAVQTYLCTDLENLSDPTRPAHRIRQDISRSPGKDSRLFLHQCLGCHAGLDPLAQAFAYHDWSPSGTGGRLSYQANTVAAKLYRNDQEFPEGYRTTDDQWINFWRGGVNSWIGWNSALPSEGQGARALAQELAETQQFAQCQVEKVFSAVCLRPVEGSPDQQQVRTMVERFTQDHDLRQAFASAAAYCMGT
jgi:hypothetical protein